MAILCSPLVLYYCKQYERFTLEIMVQAQTQPSFVEFVKSYVSYGSACLTAVRTGPDDFYVLCGFSWLAIFGYVLGVCALQLALSILMRKQQSGHARACFTMMVPLTVFAFYLG